MEKRRLAVSGIVGLLFFAAFDTVTASATPNNTEEKVLVAIIGDSYTAGSGAGSYPHSNRDGSFIR